MSVTIGDVDFEAFARQITGEGSPSDKGKTVQTCLAALKKYQQNCGSDAVQKANSMEVLGLLIAKGAKGLPEQKEQAKKIAEALIGTKLFENASHAVRNNIETALKRGTWIGAKLREALLIAFNWHKYGADSTHKQEVLLGGAIACLNEGDANLDLTPLYDSVKEYNKEHTQDTIDQEVLTRFVNAFTEEWQKIFMSDQPLAQPAVTPQAETPQAETPPAEAPPAEAPPAKAPPTASPLGMQVVVRAQMHLIPANELAQQKPLLLLTLPRRLEAQPEPSEKPLSPEDQAEAKAVTIVVARATDDRDRAKGVWKGLKAKKSTDLSESMNSLSDAEVKFLVRYAIVTLKYPERDREASSAILTWYKENVIDKLRSKDEKKYAQQEMAALLAQTPCGRKNQDKAYKASLFKIIGVNT